MFNIHQLASKIEAVGQNRLSLDAFEEWFVPAAWGHYTLDESQLNQAIASVHEILSEYNNDEISDNEAIAGLCKAVPEVDPMRARIQRMNALFGEEFQILEVKLADLRAIRIDTDRPFVEAAHRELARESRRFEWSEVEQVRSYSSETLEIEYGHSTKNRSPFPVLLSASASSVVRVVLALGGLPQVVTA